MLTMTSVLAWRGLMVGLGLLGVAWGIATLPIFWRQLPIERIASRIIEGDPFKLEALLEQLPVLEAAQATSICRPAAVRSAAIIRLRMLEETIAVGERALIDPHMSALRTAIRHSLGCSPADPFLWLVLYWVEGTMHGFKSEYLTYLRMSYRLGPNEGWIALKRNPAGFALFEQLPADLAEDVLREFIGLLNTGRLYSEVIAIFTGPAWHARDRVLPTLKNVSVPHRQALAKALSAAGYDISVPGIALPERHK